MKIMFSKSLLNFGIFDRTQNVINNLIPLFFLALSFFELSQTKLSHQWWVSGALSMDILFYGATHAAFTFVMFSYLPEYRSYVKRTSGFTGKNLTILTSIFFFSMLFLFYFSYQYFTSGLPRLLFNIFIVMYPIHHILSQTMGLSRQTNNFILQNMAVSQAPKSFILYSAYERFVILSLVPLTGLVSLGNQTFALLNNSVTLSENLKTYYLIISGGLVLSLFVLIPFIFRNHWREKMLFMSRLAVFPLIGHSNFAAMATLAMHGAEYMLVVQHMNSRSENPIQLFNFKIIIFQMIFPAIILFTRPIYREQFQTAYLDPNYIMQSISWALGFTHYFLDGFLFKMRNPDLRNTIGSLLNSGIGIKPLNVSSQKSA